MNFSLSSPCLIVVDVQNAIVHAEDDILHNKKSVMHNISRIIEKSRIAGIPVVYIQHSESEGSFAENTNSWKIVDAIKPEGTEVVIKKTTCDSFYNTSLQSHLHSINAHDLIIVGMQTEYCIDTTVRSAFGKAYKCTVIADAHSTFDSKYLSAEHMILHMNDMWSGRFATVMSTDEILKHI